MAEVQVVEIELGEHAKDLEPSDSLFAAPPKAAAPYHDGFETVLVREERLGKEGAVEVAANKVEESELGNSAVLAKKALQYGRSQVFAALDQNIRRGFLVRAIMRTDTDLSRIEGQSL